MSSIVDDTVVALLPKFGVFFSFNLINYGMTHHLKTEFGTLSCVAAFSALFEFTFGIRTRDTSLKETLSFNLHNKYLNILIFIISIFIGFDSGQLIPFLIVKNFTHTKLNISKVYYYSVNVC